MEFDHSKNGWSSGFGDPRCAITPGQLEIIAKIAGHSITTYKQRKEASDKYYKALVEAQQRKEAESGNVQG